MADTGATNTDGDTSYDYEVPRRKRRAHRASPQPGTPTPVHDTPTVGTGTKIKQKNTKKKKRKKQKKSENPPTPATRVIEKVKWPTAPRLWTRRSIHWLSPTIVFLVFPYQWGFIEVVLHRRKFEYHLHGHDKR